ncbi:hypothetical protein NQ166_11725 [Microbacterium sp. zg.Y1090]|uniref:hypothetical protein n=1 Tax=Microbacterium TaxID=33882 RepID=UPI00214BD695|nr:MULTISPECIES: hypothetical protein [unclassified Microbacterium]MCR2813178.1 hypothetical protein [Microbacterium sp. zg.Y1084]MCR2819491.1 hypothetical protein [Microbacterium sp. zg.Y1090]WIM28464.1 hypothetical protein QNO26_00795 [Microbacterium sp. zg-Y1090]
MTAAAAGVSYRVVLPPGWLLLPVRDCSDDELRRLITDQYAHLPRDSAGPYIGRLADAVVDGARQARRLDVIDILLPLGTPWQAPVSTSIAIAVGRDDDAGLAGEVVETAAGDAWRVQLERPDQALRRVEYVWRVPDAAGMLLAASFSIVGDDEPELQPIVDALTGLCDAIVATVRWDDDPPATTEAPA